MAVSFEKLNSLPAYRRVMNVELQWVPWFGIGLWGCVLRGGGLMRRFISSKGFCLWYICSSKETLFIVDFLLLCRNVTGDVCVVKSLTQYYSVIQIRIRECKGKLSTILLLSRSCLWQT